PVTTLDRRSDFVPKPQQLVAVQEHDLRLHSAKPCLTGSLAVRDLADSSCRQERHPLPGVWLELPAIYPSDFGDREFGLEFQFRQMYPVQQHDLALGLAEE